MMHSSDLSVWCTHRTFLEINSFSCSRFHSGHLTPTSLNYFFYAEPLDYNSIFVHTYVCVYVCTYVCLFAQLSVYNCHSSHYLLNFTFYDVLIYIPYKWIGSGNQTWQIMHSNTFIWLLLCNELRMCSKTMFQVISI